MHAYNNEVALYRSLSSISVWYAFGFCVFVSIVTQILTGFFMACYYEGNVQFAFDSLQFVTREVQFMWITRFVHANVASWVFFFIYVHVAKALLFGTFRSYKELMWLTGTIILFLLLLVGFSGYSLVWGQMSYWALTVITNLVTVIPFFGSDLLDWIWGNSYLTSYSLRRFFALHFLIPFIVLALGLIHMTLGHKSYTQHAYYVHTTEFDRASFGFTTLVKDIYVSWFLLMFIAYLLFIDTNKLMCPDNWLYAMAFVTPVSIEPEWYFLPYYALLRSVPHKLLGFLMLIFGVVALALLAMVSSYDNCSIYTHRTLLVSFMLNFIYLGYMAAMPMGFPYIDVCLLLVWIHFMSLVAFL